MIIGRKDEDGFARWFELARPTFSSVAAMALRSTVIIEAASETDHGLGSGFILRIPPPAAGYLPDFLVITARHNVDGAASRNAETVLQIAHLRVGEWERITVKIPINEWYYFSKHDVAIARLPLWLLTQAPSLSAFPLEMLYTELPWLGPLDVELYGATEIGENVLILARRGAMPTTEMPRVRLQNFPRPLPVNIVEGIVTHGMSGGPVIVSTGPRMAENFLLGLAHGYATPVVRNLPSLDAINEGRVKEVLVQVLAELQARRQQLVYVVPNSRILEAASEYLCTLYPDRTVSLGSLAKI